MGSVERIEREEAKSSEAEVSRMEEFSRSTEILIPTWTNGLFSLTLVCVVVSFC